MRRCHRSSVSGVTTKIDHRGLGRRRLSAASSARSRGWSRGRGCWRRRIASWWRRTRISTSLASADRQHSTINSQGGITPGRRTTRPPAPPTGHQHTTAHHSRAVTCPLTPRNDFWHPTRPPRSVVWAAPGADITNRRDRRMTARLVGGMAAGDAVGMQEIARFLAVHKPFDGLAPEALEQTAATVEVAYFPRGASILQQGGEPSHHLYVIVKGTVELRQVDEGHASKLVETLAEGETFGQVSLLSRSPHLWDVIARDDVLAYLIPAEQVERLRHQPGFEALLARRAGDRLGRALTARRQPAPLDLF